MNLLLLKGEKIPTELELFSVSGQKIILPVQQKQVDVSALARGVYIIHSAGKSQMILLN